MPDIISFNHAGAPVLSQPPKHVNHDLSPMKCPVDLDDVDLFGEGAQEHWYEAYEILHRESPVHRIEGGGLQPGTHAYVLTKHADVTRVVKDPDRFPTLMTLGLQRLAAEGLTPEEVYKRGHHLMEASMVSLRPNQELYLKHRRELTDPWVGVGATRHAAMIERLRNLHWYVPTPCGLHDGMKGLEWGLAPWIKRTQNSKDIWVCIQRYRYSMVNLFASAPRWFADHHVRFVPVEQAIDESVLREVWTLYGVKSEKWHKLIVDLRFFFRNDSLEVC